MNTERLCQFRLKMSDGTSTWRLRSQKSPGTFQKGENFRNRVHWLCEEIAEFSKIGRRENGGIS